VIGALLDLCARHRALVLTLAVALGALGWSSAKAVPLDAVPDLSDPQVVVFAEWSGRSPTLLEDQVTYPLVTAMLGAPHVADVRAQTMFGMAFVYVVFDEGTDVPSARARVQESVNNARNAMPADVTLRLGPDGSGVGWVYQYALRDRTGANDLAALWFLQETVLRPALTGVTGVAEVASVGGAAPCFQVTVDPVRLRERGVTLADVAAAVRNANGEVGGRTLQVSQREHFVRARGFVTRAEDLEVALVRAGAEARAVRVRDVGRVAIAPSPRRGVAELDGEGEVVSGIVVMTHGANAREVIERVRTRLAGLRDALPPGVEVVTAYDRAALIDRAIDTLRHTLVEEMIVVAAVIALFLLHLRSALLPIISLPLAVLVAFIPMRLLGVPATIMSLGGIAIAIGATVDAEIVMVEAAHKHLEGAENLSDEERGRRLSEAAREVTPAIFGSLLIIAASFIPVFGLTGQAGRLFRPLAYTKTFVMLGAALLSVTVAPALRDLLLRGKMRPEATHPVSRVIRAVYAPFVHTALRNPGTTVLIGLMAVLSALPIASRLGREFMPPLDEGDLLYMPSTLPGISLEEARRQLQRQDAVIRATPEVAVVLGKVGRAETPTDPAPLSMIETVVRLKPRAEWRTRYVRRWYVGRTPTWMRPALNSLWPEYVPWTREELVADLDQRLRGPGWSNAWTQPIRNRIDMQATGIRTAVGVKVHGADLAAIDAVGGALEGILRGVPGARGVFFERSGGGSYVDITPDREALAAHGLTLAALQETVTLALGAETLGVAVDGRRRFPLTLRVAEDYRGSLEALRELPIALPEGGRDALGVTRTLRLGNVARVSVTAGPSMIRDENGALTGYLYIDLDDGRDLGGFVDEAQTAVRRARERGSLVLPRGAWIQWTGQYEELAAMEARMRLLVPLALAIVVALLWLQFRDLTEVVIVLLSVPFALVGSVWALHLLDYRLSTAVWVGVIALVGLATQTGVVMIVYIDHAYARRLREGRINSLDDIVAAHAEGTIQRVRPKLMTVGTMLLGLVPMMWATGSGADVMKRIAAPMVGGLVTSAFLTLEIIPVVYTVWREEQRVLRALRDRGATVLRRLESLSTGARALGFTALGVTAARLAGLAPWRGVWTAASVLVALAGACALGYGITRRTNQEAKA
jgi:copper/silver efflux system protein